MKLCLPVDLRSNTHKSHALVSDWETDIIEVSDMSFLRRVAELGRYPVGLECNLENFLNSC